MDILGQFERQAIFQKRAEMRQLDYERSRSTDAGSFSVSDFCFQVNVGTVQPIGLLKILKVPQEAYRCETP